MAETQRISINGNDDPESAEATRYRVGTADLEAFHKSSLSLDDIFAAADTWRELLVGVEKPWLCRG